MSALLEIEKLEVTFGRTAAVRGASLAVAPGETHCLVGESGCGKSVTALSVMNLLVRNAQRRAARLAFQGEDLLKLSDRGMARLRGNRVTSAEKNNVMVTGVLWKQVVQRIHDREFADVQLSHMLADAMAMQLVRNPKQFDVIVTDNLFGDVLSDEAAQLTGSLGMLPSASLGAKDANGRQLALYEPIHGSAPDIAGQGIANPIACILSFAMCLRYSLGRGDDAKLLEKAVERVLADGYRTADIMQPGMTKLGTSAMTSAILKTLDKLAS